MSVTLHTTLGPIKLELYCQQVPNACKNFLGLCAAEKYNNTTFHRVIKSGFVQGGDTTLAGGKGGESIYGSIPLQDEIVPSLSHNRRGVVAFANKAGQINSSLSQFYILFEPQPHLDGQNTIFATMVEGDDVLSKIELISVDKKYRPVEPIVINSVHIHANPFATDSAP